MKRTFWICVMLIISGAAFGQSYLMFEPLQEAWPQWSYEEKKIFVHGALHGWLAYATAVDEVAKKEKNWVDLAYFLQGAEMELMAFVGTDDYIAAFDAVISMARTRKTTSEIIIAAMKLLKSTE